jgi:hypothetical protein
MILRCFVVNEPDFYIRLYNSLVTPKWTYCSAVWSPYFDCDKQLLQAVQDRFLKRVSWRCNSTNPGVILPSVADQQKDVDLRILKSLVMSGQLSKYFTVKQNCLRSGVNLTAPEIANSFVVNDCFSWRVANCTHSDESFMKILKTFYCK